jgi:hypothetical protein
MTDRKPPSSGSSSQNLWLEILEEMGGQFWPPEPVEEEDMPEVGAKYPMMLYDGPRECIVYDAEERAEATSHGYKPHPNMVRSDPPGIVDPPKPPGIIDPPKPIEPEPPDGPSQGLPSRSMPAPIQRQPETKTTTTATVSVQKSVEVKKPATPAPAPAPAKPATPPPKKV